MNESIFVNDETLTFSLLVAAEMSRRSSRDYSSPMLSQKLHRENLHYKEAVLIGDILGYRLKFEKI